jgi:hypothetical protein
MHKFLKQSTSVVIQFGPFVDKTDGSTLETALAGTGANQMEHTSSGILISKNGGALAARSATATASTYDAYGMYRVTLSATDTATLGSLRVAFVDAATFLPVWDDFLVVTANNYESLVGGTEYLRTHPGPFSISGTTITFKKSDNSTTQFTGTLTADAAANPIVGMSG